jgi:MFS family permease
MATVTTTTRTVAGPLIFLLGAAVFLNYVDRGAIAVAAPLMKGELGLSATKFGVAVSAFFWVYAPVQLFVGWLCDRLSVYKMMAAGIVLWSCSTVLMGFAGGFLSLLVLRVMLGVGESIAFPGTSKIIARHIPVEQRGIANAAVAAGIATGPAVGTLAGGLIVASAGWRPMFIAFGVATLIWLLPWQRLVRALSVPVRVPNDLRVPIARVIGKWPLWAMSIGHCTSNYVFYFLLAWLPLYLVQSRGFTITEMTLLATIGYAVQAVAALVLGDVSDRWTRSGRSEAFIRRWMMVASQGFSAVAVVGLVFADRALPLVILLSLAGAATAALSVNLYAIAQMFAGPRAAGTWVGVQNAFGNSSGIFQPIIAGIIIDRAGYASAFYLTAAIAAFGALWWAVGVPAIRQLELD